MVCVQKSWLKDSFCYSGQLGEIEEIREEGVVSLLLNKGFPAEHWV